MIETVFKAQPGPQTDFLESQADICIYGGSAGGGKLLCVNTKIPTPVGWSTMGDLRIGDQVFCDDGSVCNVTWKSDIDFERTFRITFSDHSTIIAGERHEWVTQTELERLREFRQTDLFRENRKSKRKSRSIGKRPDLSKRNSEQARLKAPRVYSSKRTTLDIFKSLYGRGGRCNHSIPLHKPVFLKEKDLPIDPYCLGAWLGDGSKSTGVITGLDDGIFDQFSNNGYLVTKYSDDKSRGIRGLIQKIKSAGLYRNKHIPNQYLRSSINQRIALLQGLMDTDGYADPDGAMEFTNTNKAIADGFIELLLSLGIKANLSVGDAKLNGRFISKKYRISFMSDIPCFRLERKLVRQKLSGFRGTHNRRYITNVEEIEKVPLQCIEVDSKNHCYLAGEQWITTHNSFSLLLEPLRHIGVDGFNAVIYRRETTQVTNPGGLWDKAREMYGPLGAEFKEQKLEVNLGRAKIKFAHLEHENDIFSWDGSEICLEGFDELQSFTERQFWYLLSRNRSLCGIRPYVRATCNPEPDSWLSRLISWWWDAKTGYAIPERSGVIRYFIRLGDKIQWADTKEELIPMAQDAADIKSFTFIKSSVFDNKILLSKDPGYVGNLRALPEYEREIKLHGNWKIKRTRGMLFKREWFKIIPRVPVNPRTSLPIERKIVRAWDRASTEKTETNDPNHTAGVKLSKATDGNFYVEHVAKFRKNPSDRDNEMVALAHRDGRQTHIRLIQDPAQAGESEIRYLVPLFQGFVVNAKRESGGKIERANPVASQAGFGKIVLIEGDWNDDFLNELDGFTGEDKNQDDMVMALCSAFQYLTGERAVIQVE